MSIETFISVILDSLLYGATAIVLSLGSREFRLYNLACGAWVVLGGWLATLVLVHTTSFEAPGNYWLVLCTVGAIILQVGIPFLKTERILSHPLAYLFTSLGIGLFLINFVPATLLNGSYSSVPFSRTKWSIIIFIAFSCLVSMIVLKILQSKWWADLAINLRLERTGWRFSGRLASLILLEILLFLVIGAVGLHIHRGHFYRAETRTIIPILAVFLSKANPWRGAATSFFVVFLGHLIVAISPHFLGVNLSNYAEIIALSTLIIFSIIRHPPFGRSRVAPIIHGLPGRIDRLGYGYEFWRILASAITFVITSLVLIVARILFPEHIPQFSMNLSLFVASLVTIAWIIQRYFGVRTIALPTIGMLALYILYHCADKPLICVLGVGGLMATAVLFMWYLRVLDHETALLLDLSAVLCIYLFVKNTPKISGTDEALILTSGWIDVLSKFQVAIMQIVVMICLFFVPIFFGHLRKSRAYILGLASLKVGCLNGIRIWRAFSLLISIPIGITIALTILFHLSSVPISVSRMHIEDGLVVLLFGYLMHRGHYVLTYVGVFLLYGYLFLAAARWDIQSGAILGMCLILTPLLLKPRIK